MEPETLNASLHHALIRHILDHGHGPDAQELSRILGLPEPVVVAGLRRLAEDHGVVLHPHRPEVWAIPVSHSRF
jgi:DNA-binding GntR family transcriptional regulator